MAQPHKALLGHTTKNYSWSPNAVCIFLQVSSFSLQYILPFDMTHFTKRKLDHGRAFESVLFTALSQPTELCLLLSQHSQTRYKMRTTCYSTITCLKSFWLFKDKQAVLCSGGCRNTEITIFLAMQKVLSSTTLKK